MTYLNSELGSSILRWGSALAAVAALVLSSELAHAETSTVLALDLGGAVAKDELQADTGKGFKVRLGKQYELPLLMFAGEFAGGYHSFSGGFEPKVYRGLVGARFGVGAMLRPVVFGHVGLGKLSSGLDAAAGTDRTALAYDLGAGIDFTLLPLVDLGLHGSYNVVNGKDGGDNFAWYGLDLSAAIVF